MTKCFVTKLSVSAICKVGYFHVLSPDGAGHIAGGDGVFEGHFDAAEVRRHYNGTA